MGKAPLLDAAVRNGEDSSTFAVSMRRLQGLVAGLKKKCELCENTGTVCNNFGEPVRDGVEGQKVELSLWFKN